jgi:8-oxo-dGTP diphosphatase
MPISDWVRKIRETIGHDMLVMVGAAAVIRNDEGRILLQKRTDNLLWGLPGGAIEPSEEPAEAAVREVYEETGFRVVPIRLVGVFGGKQQVITYPNGDRTAYVSITFECRIIGGEINPDPEETLEARWFEPDKLPANFVPAHRRRIHHALIRNTPFFALPEKPLLTSESNYIQTIRQRIGHEMIMCPGTTALIFNEDGQILVQHRRDNGLWGLPGGNYEPGEEPAETMIREVYEETGLIVQPKRLVGVYGGKDYIYTYPNGDTVAYINIVFQCEMIEGNLKQNDNESLDQCYVSTEDLPQPFIEPHRLLIDHALNQKDTYFAFRLNP